MKDEAVFLRHIQDAIAKIETYTEGGKAAFFENSMIQDSVIRNLEVIGEAARNLSPGFRKKHSKVPWRGIMGMRNVLTHEYFGVDLHIVWKVVSKRIPTLKRHVVGILKKEKGSTK
ncbi:MAG: DUF86 domain-containing protein [Nitrospira sp.]|nr:DUF86 domain-containing protein [Nitrospira sp.]